MALATSDTITLDPSAVATSRTALALSGTAAAGLIDVRSADYGNAEIEQYLSDRRYGSVPVGHRLPNRTVEFALRIQAAGTVGVGVPLRNLQRKVALLQSEGGWLGRTLGPRTAGEYGADVLYADVVDASLSLPSDWTAQRQEVYLDATLTLTCLPDFYGAEVLAGSANSASPHDSVSLLGTISGDYPARSRYTITDTASLARQTVIVGSQARDYDSAATAALAYEAEVLTALDLATKSALTGALGGTAVVHSSVTPTWTPVVSTLHASSGELTHTGTYRLLARCSTNFDAEVRVEYSVGDAATRRVNASAALGGGEVFYLLDLGEVRLPKAPIGTQRWQGQITARNTDPVETTSIVAIDKLYLVPAAESLSIARARRAADAAYTPGAYIARDSFSGTAGTATGRSLEIGGTWAGAGDSTDYSLDGSGRLIRTAVSDSSITNGRYFFGTATAAEAAVQVKAEWLNTGSVADWAGRNMRVGVIGRYVNTSNYAIFFLDTEGALTFWAVEAGILEVEQTISSGYLSVAGLYYKLRLWIGAGGAYAGWVWAGDAADPPGAPQISGAYSGFATGGAMETGKFGIYDAKADAGAASRYFDLFSVTTPVPDGAVLSGKSLSLRHDGAWRESSTAGIYAPANVEGNYPRDPVSGVEGRTTRTLIRPSVGDLETLPDQAGAFTVTRHYRPTYLFVPEA